eukprot:1926811-Heterocapsa_arctica.AAC.1
MSWPWETSMTQSARTTTRRRWWRWTRWSRWHAMPGARRSWRPDGRKGSRTLGKDAGLEEGGRPEYLRAGL